MAAPVGNQNASKKTRMLGEALKRILVQNPEEAEAVARKTLEAAKAGEAWAQALIYERVDGRLPQPVVGDEDEPPILLRGLIELVRPGS
jgi:DNA gyrase/topoisomerase IV subunit B